MGEWVGCQGPKRPVPRLMELLTTKPGAHAVALAVKCVGANSLTVYCRAAICIEGRAGGVVHSVDHRHIAAHISTFFCTCWYSLLGVTV